MVVTLCLIVVDNVIITCMLYALMKIKLDICNFEVLFKIRISIITLLLLLYIWLARIIFVGSSAEITEHFDTIIEKPGTAADACIGVEELAADSESGYDVKFRYLTCCGFVLMLHIK